MKTLSKKDIDEIRKRKGIIRRKKPDTAPVEIKGDLKNYNERMTGLVSLQTELTEIGISKVIATVEKRSNDLARIVLAASNKKRQFRFDINRDKRGLITSVDVNEI